MIKQLTGRESFLHDVFVTAIEGGIDFWAHIKKYRWSDGDGNESADAYALIEEDEEGAKEQKIDLDTIRKAFGQINKTKAGEKLPGLSAENVARFKQAYKEFDAGDIDSYDASCIVQLGLFGEVIYG